MAVYLVNIALIIFWRLYFTQKKYPDARKYYCGIVALQWILISGLRDWSIGADTYTYYTMFERVKNTSWGTVLGDLFQYSFEYSGRDPGYAFITKVFQLFSGNYQLFLLAVAAFFMSTMAAWIYRHSASPCTSFILFSTLFYSYETLTRQIIAIALVVFIGYDLIEERKFWKFFAVVFMAFFVHKSSLIFMPLYFISKIPITLGYMLLCGAIVILVAVLGETLYGPVAGWLGYEGFLDYAEGGAELYATLLILLCTAIWILYPRIKKHRKDADILFHINVLSLISAFLVFHNQSFMRIQLYFSLFLMITIPEVINTVKREYRLLVYLLFGAAMILYLIWNKPQYYFFGMS